MTSKLISVAFLASVVIGCQEKPAPTPKPASTSAATPSASAAGGSGAVAALKVPDVKYSASADDIKKGEALFASKGCVACHKIGGGKLVGPDLKGVTGRRQASWIARMILYPDVMTREDDTARDLLKTYMTAMTNQGINADSDLPLLMSYLKANEK